jgi:hypothetical protein
VSISKSANIDLLKIQCREARAARATVDVFDPFRQVTHMSQQSPEKGAVHHYDRHRQPGLPVFMPGFRTVVFVELVICWLVMGTKW